MYKSVSQGLLGCHTHPKSLRTRAAIFQQAPAVNIFTASMRTAWRKQAHNWSVSRPNGARIDSARATGTRVSLQRKTPQRKKTASVSTSKGVIIVPRPNPTGWVEPNGLFDRTSNKMLANSDHSLFRYPSDESVASYQGGETDGEGDKKARRDLPGTTNGTVFKRPFELSRDSDGTVWGLRVTTEEMWDSLAHSSARSLQGNVSSSPPSPPACVERSALVLDRRPLFLCLPPQKAPPPTENHTTSYNLRLTTPRKQATTAQALRVSNLKSHGAKPFPNFDTAEAALFREAGLPPPKRKASPKGGS